MVYLKSCGGARSEHSADTLSRFHPPKPQDRALIKEERYRVRKIEVRAMPFDNGPRAEELLQRYKKYSSERLVDMLAKKMLESGALRIEERPAAGKFGGSELRATIYVAMPEA